MKKRHIILTLGLMTLSLQGCDLINAINYVDDKQAFYESIEDDNAESTDSLEDGLFKDNTEDKKEKNTSSSEIAEGRFEAEWIGTTDGDTIKIKSKERGTETVRLLLIDTPESVKIGTEQQLYSLNASRYTKALMKENKTVTIEVGTDEYDEYERLLAYVYLEDGSMLNELLVRNGYARVGYIFEGNTKYLEQLQNAQAQAQAQKLRIWSVDGYVTDNGFNMDVVTDKDIMNSVEY